MLFNIHRKLLFSLRLAFHEHLLWPLTGPAIHSIAFLCSVVFPFRSPLSCTEEGIVFHAKRLVLNSSGPFITVETHIDWIFSKNTFLFIENIALTRKKVRTCSSNITKIEPNQVNIPLIVIRDIFKSGKYFQFELEGYGH